MNKVKFWLVSFLLFGISNLYSQGTVITSSFYSSSLNQNRSFEIYLPQGYEDDSDVFYPVVYFLHGFGAYGSYTWGVEDILNDGISTGELLPMIVVLPDGGSVEYEGSFYTNSEFNGPFKDYIVQDLVTFIDENYRTYLHPHYRAVSGHSMGGYGTMKLAMLHPEIFSSLAAHSGPIAFELLDNPLLINFFLIENFGQEFSPNNGSLSQMLFAMSAAFSPNMENPPWYVDMPLDNSGDIISEVFDRWMDHDPFTLLDSYAESLSDQNIYIDCGSYDELQLAPHSEAFSERLNELGIEHIYESYSGNHSNMVAERMEISFQFHSDHFADPPAEECTAGDVNVDGMINVIDVVNLVNIVLDTEQPTDEELCAGDMNGDGLLNVLDIILVVNIILES